MKRLTLKKHVFATLQIPHAHYNQIQPLNRKWRRSENAKEFFTSLMDEHCSMNRSIINFSSDVLEIYDLFYSKMCVWDFKNQRNVEQAHYWWKFNEKPHRFSRNVWNIKLLNSLNNKLLIPESGFHSFDFRLQFSYLLFSECWSVNTIKHFCYVQHNVCRRLKCRSRRWGCEENLMNSFVSHTFVNQHQCLN